MYRSPPQLRSGSKVRPVLLSKSCATDKKLGHSLSAPSTPTDISTTMPQDNKADVIDPAFIESCVSRYLAGQHVFDALVTKLAEKMKEVVESAVRDAMTAANKELVRLRDEVTKLTERLEDRTDDLEQYQRRNNLRIFGVEETPGEDTDQLVIKLCSEKLGVELPESAVCRSHRVGKQPGLDADGRRRHRPIIIRLTSYRERRRVFDVKKKLKGSGIAIKEDLTSRRLEVLRKATAIHGPRNTWTRDGTVLWVDQTGARGSATRLADLTPSSRA